MLKVVGTEATRDETDWFHKLGNILDKLPKRLQPRVKAALREWRRLDGAIASRRSLRYLAPRER